MISARSHHNTSRNTCAFCPSARRFGPQKFYGVGPKEIPIYNDFESVYLGKSRPRADQFMPQL